MSGYTISKILHVSISHLSEDGRDFLYDNEADRLGRSGFLIPIGIYTNDNEDLKNIVDLAKKLQCVHILLDCGEPVYPELEEFENEDW